MQKLHKSKTPKVYKNKKLNNANFGTYNLNDYQVFLQLISMTGGVDELGKYLQPEELQREHTLTAKAFSVQFGVDINTSYGVLKRVAKRLTETSLTLEKPELFVTQHIALCSQTEYNHKQGSLSVRFTDEIMPYLAQVKTKFVLYNLKEVANFGSLYTTRLYELIQEFKDTGWLKKSVTQLREVFAVGKKFPDYCNFKLKTFSHAVDEINSQYEIDLKFEEIKEGRKVAAIRFDFKPTIIQKAIDPRTGNERNIYTKPRQKRKDPPDVGGGGGGSGVFVHPEQQELPLEKPLLAVKIKKATGKILKPILTKEVFQATQDNTSLMKAAAEVRDNRKEVIQTTIATLTEMFKEKTIDLETFSLAIQNLQQS